VSEYVTVNVKGLDELQKRLDAAPAKLGKKSLKDAVKAGCNVIRNSIIQFAPKRSGFLAKHFGSKVRLYNGVLAASGFIGPQGKMDYPDENGGYRIKRNKKGRARKVGRVAVASVARFLEFGTSKMGHRPFMTQAFERDKFTAMNAMTEKLKEGLDDL
jgi:HK97 gp10 family phage protein